MTHNVPPLKGPRPHVCSTRLVLFKKKKKSRSALITTLIRLSLQALQIAHCFGTWPLSDNCVWLNNTSPVVAKNDTTLLFTPKPLCFNHSWDSLKKKKKINRSTLENLKTFQHSGKPSKHALLQQNAVKQRRRRTHTAPMTPWMCLWEKQPERRESR